LLGEIVHALPLLEHFPATWNPVRRKKMLALVRRGDGPRQPVRRVVSFSNSGNPARQQGATA